MSRESRFISRVLRHAPQDAGLTLDAHGWAPVKLLLKGLRAAGFKTTHADLLTIVAENDKKRFEISENGLMIRASQGHSVEIDLQLTPQIPPATLFHGTTSGTLHPIFKDGILPMKRHHVHLSETVEVAHAVGSRHGAPIILAVNADEMHAAGMMFYRSVNGVWLTLSVPVGMFSISGARPEGAPQ